MKLTISPDALADALDRVGTCVASSVQTPIYRNVHLETVNTQVTLTATDGDRILSYTCTELAEDAADGAALVPYNRLAPVVKSAPGDSITLESSDSHLQVRTQDGRFRLLGENPADLPRLPDFPAEAVAIGGIELAKMLRSVRFACAEEKGRYALHGVLLHVESASSGGKASFVAADGARLAYNETDDVVVESNPEENETRVLDVILPAPAAETLQHLAEGTSETLRLAAEGGRLYAHTTRWRFAAQLAEGRFPNYADIIPSETDVTLRVEAADLQSVVDRAALMTTDETRVVDWQVEEGTLTVSAESPDVGEGTLWMPLDDGDEATVSFNPRFLHDALQLAEPDEVWHIGLGDRRDPALFRRIGHVAWKYVVSPVIKEDAER